MNWDRRIEDVQKHLLKEKLDGWLLYDFQGNNPLAKEFLTLDPELMITRRFFYWIPARGEPIKILHRIETHVLHSLPGKETIYLTWQELEATLKNVLKNRKTIAMEFSPRCAVPYLSKLDAGTADLIRSFGIEIASSAPFLQYYTCVLDQEQLAFHLEAASFLDKTAAFTWKMVSDALKSGKQVDEYQVRQFIADQFTEHGFITEGLPICAVNEHSADPHYEPPKTGSTVIKRGDFILIDLWCKKKHPRAVYGDITRIAVADTHPTPRQQEIFNIVRMAQQAATDFVISGYKQGEKIMGFEVDQVCRSVIENKGYGHYFPHRTGHNIYTKDHGPGAHVDSLETNDIRPLIPKTCFSIEPGIYLPQEFGLRLEYDVYLGENGEAQVTGGIQDRIVTLL